MRYFYDANGYPDGSVARDERGRWETVPGQTVLSYHRARRAVDVCFPVREAIRPLAKEHAGCYPRAEERPIVVSRPPYGFEDILEAEGFADWAARLEAPLARAILASNAWSLEVRLAAAEAAGETEVNF